MKMMKSTGWYNGKTMHINPLAVDCISELDGHAVIYMRGSDDEDPGLYVKESVEEVARIWAAATTVHVMIGGRTKEGEER
jgi:hypothetical protein